MSNDSSSGESNFGSTTIINERIHNFTKEIEELRAKYPKDQELLYIDNKVKELINGTHKEYIAEIKQLEKMNIARHNLESKIKNVKIEMLDKAVNVHNQTVWKTLKKGMMDDLCGENSKEISNFIVKSLHQQKTEISKC